MIELPPTGNGSSEYKITKIDFSSSSAIFADAAKNRDGEWKYASSLTTEEEKNREQAKIKDNPQKTFGLFMSPGNGFDEATQNTPMVISVNTADNIVKQEAVKLTNATPQVELYLTYYNDGITISQDLGSVKIEAVRANPDTKTSDTIILQIDIVTKASELTSQTIDLYATQSGSYTGKWIIPAGADRTMRLAKTATSAGSLVEKTDSLTGNQFAVAMQPEKGLGWKTTTDFMASPYYLKPDTPNILLGSTDNRYEAPVHFTMYNASGFPSGSEDTIVLTFQATDSQNNVTNVDITLKIHWEESVVSRISAAAGKHFDDFTGETDVRISGESSVTSAFEIGKNSNAGELWLELQNREEKTVSLPPGTKMILLYSGNQEVYTYEIMGEEADDRIELTDFKQMWSQTAFSGVIAQSRTLMAVMEFDGDSSLPPGEYSLHLRDDKSADTAKAVFTVDNTLVSVTLSGGDHFQEPKAEYQLNLAVNAGNDTRLSKGTAVVFTLDQDSSFPEGTIFTHNGMTYTPINGKVYILLDTGVASHPIIMDTRNSAGLMAGEHDLTAKILSVGLNAGSKVISSDGKVTYTVKAIPQYGLKVDSGSSRNVAAGSTLEFRVSYSYADAGEEALVIGVAARRKSGGSYGGEESWLVSGNDPITPGKEGASASQDIRVTVPQGTAPGTYRLIFTFGDKAAVYNIIVAADNR